MIEVRFVPFWCKSVLINQYNFLSALVAELVAAELVNTLSWKELNEANVAGDTANVGNWNAGPVGKPLPNLGDRATGLRVPGPHRCIPGISGVL